MARPRLGEKKKTKSVTVFFTPDEYEQITRKAERAGTDAPDFLRRAALGKRIIGAPPEANREAIFELNAIGRNLNQLLVLLRLQEIKEWLELETTINRTTEQIRRAVKDLISGNSSDVSEETNQW